MPKEENRYSYLNLLRIIQKSTSPYRNSFLFGSFLRISSDIMSLYNLYTMASMIGFFGHYRIGDSLYPFWLLIAKWLFSYLYVITVRQIAKFVCYQVAVKTNFDNQLRAIKHLSLLDIAWHEKENTGNKLKRIRSGSEGLERLIRIWADNIIQSSINFIGMTAILAVTDLKVGLIMIFYMVFYTIVSIPLSARAHKAARKVNQEEEDFDGLSFEVLNNVRSVKVMGMFDRLYTLLDAQKRRIISSVRTRVFHFRFKSGAQGYATQVFRVAAFVVIAFGIASGQYEVGFLVLFNFYFTGVRTSIEDLSDLSQDITIARYNIFRLQTIFEEKIKIDDNTSKIDFPINWKKIRLNNVSFGYGDNIVLRNVSFDINRGEKIGIVGLSGAGKSTLFKLMLKEYENFTGDIFFDDVSIRDIKKSSFYNRVAVVLQETEVFNFSLKDNIQIAGDGKPNALALETALETAHVSDFMAKLPEGVNTLIGEKGVKLSGGEKQRLGIARAVYKQPDILFLDEATSHLDLESEEIIKDSLHKFFQNVTAVVIAHRLTTIQEMDRIILIEGGEILEQGSFKELSKKHGRFFQLWEKQRL